MEFQFTLEELDAAHGETAGKHARAIVTDSVASVVMGSRDLMGFSLAEALRWAFGDISIIPQEVAERISALICGLSLIATLDMSARFEEYKKSEGNLMPPGETTLNLCGALFDYMEQEGYNLRAIDKE